MHICRYDGMLVCKNARISIEVCRYAYMQVFRYVGMQVCEYAGIQECNYAGMQYEDMQTSISLKI